jgi:hypothetical protein
MNPIEPARQGPRHRVQNGFVWQKELFTSNVIESSFATIRAARSSTLALGNLG